MKNYILVFLILLMIKFSAFSQIVINEVQTSNKQTLADEDGDFEDWIEFYNSGNSAVNLYNYGLSDDPANLFKWRFPAVTIGPKDYILVFASGKNRKPAFNHWETAVFAQDEWRYFVGTQNPPSGWNQQGFDASAWLSGPGGIGYGDNDDATVIAPAISIFMRREFPVSDVSQIGPSLLSMDFDDGFIAYLNGTEIARANMNGILPAFSAFSITDHEAAMYQGGTPAHFAVDTALLKTLLINGTNVLSVEVHNAYKESSDLSSIPFLSFGIKSNQKVFKPVPVWFPQNMSGNLHSNFKLKSGEPVFLTFPSGTVADKQNISFNDIDYSQCRIPDGSSGWSIVKSPTPRKTNNSSLFYSGYTERPNADIAPGFYKIGQKVSLSSPNPGSDIHYTLDGKTPEESDLIYTQPISIDTSVVLRARCFGPTGFLPGKILTITYIIGSRSYKLPVVSVTTDPDNLWDYYTGIYATGPNAETTYPYFGANFWQDWDRDAHIEYFSPMGPEQFAFDAGISIHGGWSQACVQKSFNVKTQGYFDSSEIKYKLFGDKPISDFKSFILRNAGNDWMNTHIRDALMQRIMKNTSVDYMAYAPSVVYLNGQYWGIYNIRERNNKDFIEENHGVNADSLDVIVNDGEVSDGDDKAFWQMVNYIKTNDMSVKLNYEVASAMWDMPGYVDYFIAETYYINDDWIGDWTNNVKLWRQRKAGAKWNYMLWDVDFGLGLYDKNADRNKLASTINPVSQTPHSDIFRQFLGNAEFKKHFINRYADLINTIFLPSSINSQIKLMADSIAEEFPFAAKRWDNVSNSSQWLGNINSMKSFISSRPNYARKHINTTFSLNGLIPVTLAVSPQNSGEIKINTIYPGVFPWTGTYFNGNPITITAIAKPGFKFLYWLSNTYLTSDTSRSLTINLDHSDTFQAVFTGWNALPTAEISEVNYHSDSTRNSGDWLEVHNYGNISVDLSDWHLTDSKFYNDFTFPTGTTLPIDGYMVIAEDTSLFKSSYPGIACMGPLGFGLSNKQDNIKLLDLHSDTIVSFVYYDSIAGLETADGMGRTLELRQGSSNFNDPASWFAGCMGGSPGEAYHACDDNVLFSEINYNSAVSADAGDWVELFNHGSNSIDVSGWKFSDSENLHLFSIPTGTIIPPGEYLVLYGDKAKFESTFPYTINKAGPFNFGLSGSGEAIRLFDKTGKLRFSVIYNDDPPWPKTPDGQGYTLELADEVGYMCDGLNWFAGCPDGSPGTAYSYPCLTGINELDKKYFSVSPNPATTEVYILQNGNNAEKADIHLSDALGRIVLVKQVNFGGMPAARISLEGINNGIYHVTITSDNNKPPQVIKIIVTK